MRPIPTRTRQTARTPNFIALAALFFASCAHGLVGQLPTVPDPTNAAELIVARDERFIGGGASLFISIDGTRIYAIRIGEHVRILVPAGERIVGA